MSSKETTNQTKTRRASDVDMSERGITGRFEVVRALYALGRSLQSIDLSQATSVESK